MSDENGQKSVIIYILFVYQGIPGPREDITKLKHMGIFRETQQMFSVLYNVNLSKG